jgi:hypothetical protein
MQITVLSVPECPNVTVLAGRLREVLGGRQDVAIAYRVIDTQADAERTGMRGSPTLLVNGVDPFADADEPASVSCRLYRGSDGAIQGAPSIDQLRQVLGEPSRDRI